MIVIARLPPVWITLKLAVNERDTGRLAARIPDLVSNSTTNGIDVAGGEISIVCVKAFHPAGRSPYPAAWSMKSAGRNEGVAFACVSAMRVGDCLSQPGIRFDLVLGLPNSPAGFDPRDSTVG
ncbi:MAG: hypothetical protein WBN38_07720 [Polyangiales bacterium]